MRPARELILIHSPLVGPASWQPSAEALRQRGWHCRVPTPTTHADRVPRWNQWSARLCDELHGTIEPILVGHSAAGLLLPALAKTLAASALIYVDANVPPSAGRVRPVDDDFLTFIAALPIDRGRLPPWSKWWGDGLLQTLIADPTLRARFEADLPRMDLAWFDDDAEVPAWDTTPCGYLRLSSLYEPQALAAQERGWPVIHIDGTHLHTALEPRQTADALLSIIDSIEHAGGFGTSRGDRAGRSTLR